MSRTAPLNKKPRRFTSTDETLDFVRSTLATTMIKTSIPEETIERLRSGPFGLVLKVPTSQHIAMTMQALRSVVGFECVIDRLDGLVAASVEVLTAALRRERGAIAVVDDLEQVPMGLRILMDETIHLLPHDQSSLARVVNACTGEQPVFPDDFVTHPDIDLVCRCIASGLPMAKTIASLVVLERTSRSGSREALPPLVDCIEFGEARDWGLRVIRDLASWEAGEVSAADLDTAALLVSPPGHGKTYFARVLAQSMKAKPVELTIGSIFSNDGHLGPVISDLRAKFDEAAQARPSVLLIDELDSFSRRDAPDGNRSFTNAVINELLTLIDGASGRSPGMVIVAATNMPEAIEPALLRPGRISTTIRLPLPRAEGVEHILRTHLRGDLVDQSLDDAVRFATGMTPAALMGAVRAARTMAREEQRAFAIEHLERAIIGPGSADEETHSRVCVHEAGHALAAMLIPGAPLLHSISTLPARSTKGRVSLVDPDGATTRTRLRSKVMVLLAGRAAEEIVLGEDPSDGASGDLFQATRLVARMHAQWGMANSLLHHRDVDHLLVVDGDFARAIDADLRDLFTATSELLEEHKAELEALADALRQRRVLAAEEAAMVVQSCSVTRPTAATARIPRTGTVSYRTVPEESP